MAVVGGTTATTVVTSAVISIIILARDDDMTNKFGTVRIRRGIFGIDPGKMTSDYFEVCIEGCGCTDGALAWGYDERDVHVNALAELTRMREELKGMIRRKNTDSSWRRLERIKKDNGS